MKIGDRTISPAHPVYIIGELGVNHDGSVARALELVDAAADAGADAIKTQYFEADRLMSRASRLAAYQRAAGESDPIDMLRRLQLSLDDMARIIDRAHARGVHAIVTVFSVELVSGARTLAWDAYKSASPDIIHRPLLEAVASTGAPVILSTGAADEAEILCAREWFAPAARDHRLAFLQCVSSYPTRDEDASLGGIDALRALDLGLVGYSDHTPRIDTGFWAVRRGACILEKHLTYDTRAAGPDHGASLDPAQFREYCDLARRAPSDPPPAPSADLVGPIAKRILPCEQDVRSLSRQSIVAARTIGAGVRLTRDTVTFKRPGTGIAPFRLDEILARSAARTIVADTPIAEDDLR